MLTPAQAALPSAKQPPIIPEKPPQTPVTLEPTNDNNLFMARMIRDYPPYFVHLALGVHAPTNPDFWTVAYSFAYQLQQDINVTCCIGPRPRGGSHPTGDAFDLGRNSNPGLNVQNVRNAYNNSLYPDNTMGMEETSCFHIQFRPGPGNSTGWRQGLRTTTGVLTNSR